MRAILVNPPYSEFVYARSKIGAAIEMPLGLAYIAAVLEREKIGVSVLDANAERISIPQAAERVASHPAEVVGVTSTTVIVPVVYKICEEIRRRCDKTVVVGGPHVTFMDVRTLEECRAIDIVVRGEGEFTLLELISKGGNPEGIKGLTYRDKKTGEIVVNEGRERMEDIDALPFPARHLFPVDRYRPGVVLNIGVSGKKYASMLTARGCPYKCTYCSSGHFWGPKVRLRSPEKVVEEIESLVQRYGVKEIFIKDDTFTIPAKRTERICDLILEKGIKVKWCCYARVDTLTRELVRKMKAAGCFGIDFGIESGNQEILDRAKKHITLSQSRKALQYAREEGMMVYASFMLGLPGDNQQTAQETIEFARELRPDFAHFFIATPFPGTEFYDLALEKGWVRDVDSWGDLSLAFSTKTRNEALSNAEIRHLISQAYRSFYARPAYFWQALRRIVRNPKELRQYVLGALVVFNLAEA